jgi:hypothetical protein
MLGIDVGVVMAVGIEDGLVIDAGAEVYGFGEKESTPAGDGEAPMEQPATRPTRVSPTARALSRPRLVRW